MKILDIPMNQKNHCDVFEELIRTDQIQFTETSLDDQDKWVQATATLYLSGEMPGTKPIPWKLGNIGVRDPETGLVSVCFKVEDDILSYLDVYPCSQQFMFIKDEKHQEAIHPDEYMLQMMSSVGLISGGRVVVRDDGSSAMDIDLSTGGKARLIDPRKRRKLGKE